MSGGFFLLGRVDPGCARQFGGAGGLPTKRSGWAGRRRSARWARGLDGWGAAVVDVGGGVQAEPAVAVLVVVPAEEFLAVRPGGLDRGEAGRESRPVLQGLELRFGVGIVVADVRAGNGTG